MRIKDLATAARRAALLPIALHQAAREVAALRKEVDSLRRAVGRLEASHGDYKDSPSTMGPEFQVYSQWGEDGVIQHLLRHVPIDRPLFVEFGVEDYHESNTRFLLTDFGWSGLVIDSSRESVAAIQQSEIYWRHSLSAVHATVTAENINQLLVANGFSGDIGLLSVDIDGNDYWTWRAITEVSPRIVVCEYNSLFGPSARVTVPYEAGFVRCAAHYSHLFFGASLAALADLAAAKGYALVGSNAAGCNAFFVRRDVLGALPAVQPAEAYVRFGIREARGPSGDLVYASFDEAQAIIRDMRVTDLTTGRSVPLRDAVGWQLSEAAK